MNACCLVFRDVVLILIIMTLIIVLLLLNVKYGEIVYSTG